MKSALALLFLAATAFAQDQSAIATVQAACGPKDVQFDAKKDSSQHPASHDDAGKAIVYFIGDGKGLTRPTIRVGVDGVWAGATTPIPTFLSCWNRESITSAPTGSPPMRIPWGPPCCTSRPKPARLTTFVQGWLAYST